MRAWNAELYDSKSNVQFELGMKIINELDIEDGEKILDIGCGTGRLTIELAKRTPSGLVIGLDNNQNMINKANNNLNKAVLNNVKFLKDEIFQYNPKIKFDVVFSNSALHWIAKTDELYQKIYDLLAPGGRLSAQVATKGAMSQTTMLINEPIQPLNLTRYFKNWRHPIKLISARAYERILSNAGFIDIRIEKMAQKIPFNNYEDLLDFLQTAPLVPVLSPLPEDKKAEYLDYFLKILKEKELLEVEMKRLFIKAKK